MEVTAQNKVLFMGAFRFCMEVETLNTFSTTSWKLSDLQISGFKYNSIFGNECTMMNDRPLVSK